MQVVGFVVTNEPPVPPDFAPKAQLMARGLRPKKHFGQNFLADPRLCRAIALACLPEPGGTVLELGAGLGALTAPLLERAARVIAVERDRDLVPELHSRFESEIAEGKLIVLEADAKSIPLDATVLGSPGPHVLAGNLPYQIVGPLLELAIRSAHHFRRIVFLVQLEVADRLAAAPGSQAYGALSVFAQACATVRRAFVVRRGAFYPVPGVDSAVVVLEPLATPISEETPAFRAVVSGAFSQRRKQLRNAWKGLLDLEPAAVEAAAARANIDLSLRGETLSPTDFARMTRELEA